MFSSLHFRRKTTVQLFLGLAFLGVLSGCGENKIGETKNPVQPNIVSNSSSESGTISVPQIAQNPVQQNTSTLSQSGTESLSGSETINGIVVPPEPSPELNNATLAGVDVNNNGVRDDVERILAARSVNTESNAKLKLMAQHFQNVIISSRPISRAEAISYERKYSCAIDMPGMVPKELSQTQDQMLSQIVANTEARKIALSEYYKALGYSIDSRETSCVK